MNSYIIISLLLLFVLLALWGMYLNKKDTSQIFLGTADFPQVKDIEDNWHVLATEIPKFDPKDPNIKSRDRMAWNNDKAKVLLEKLKNNKSWVRSWWKNIGWYQFPLMYHGHVIGKAGEICPKTIDILKKHPEIQIAGFALLTPGTTMPTHNDGTGKGYNSMACNLALKTDDAGLYVENSKGKMVEYKHKLGKMVIFDAENEHYADNKHKKENRVILYMDISTKNTAIGTKFKGAGLSSKLGFPTVNMTLDKKLECGFYGAKTKYGKITLIAKCNGDVECHFLNYKKRIDKDKKFNIWDIEKINAPDDQSILSIYNQGCSNCSNSPNIKL